MRLTFFSAFLFVFSQQLYAQQWLGIAPSNYGGTYSVYLNPANAADSRYKVFVNIAGADASILNTYTSWNAPFSMLSFISNSVSSQYKNAEGTADWKNSYLGEKVGKENTTAFVNAELRGPAILFSVNDKLSVGITTRMRLLMNENNTSSNVAHLAVAGTGVTDDQLLIHRGNHFVFNLNGYSEIAATLGYIVREEDENFVKIGITAKRVSGIANTHVVSDNIDYQIFPNGGRTQTVRVFNSTGQYGGVLDEGLIAMKPSLANFLGTGAAGTGYGFDLGFVYEYRPDYENYSYRGRKDMKMDKTKNKYKFRISAALLDIGSVNFNSATKVSQVSINNDPARLIQAGDFNQIASFSKLNTALNKMYQVDEANVSHQFNAPLPMALSTNVDYKIKENVYVSAIWIQSLRSQNAVGMQQPSMIAIIPRYETKWFEASMPIAMQNGYQNFTLGLVGRAGPIFIGSDNLAWAFNIGHPTGLDIYAGVFIPLYQKNPESQLTCESDKNTTFKEKLKSLFKKK